MQWNRNNRLVATWLGGVMVAAGLLLLVGMPDWLEADSDDPRVLGLMLGSGLLLLGTGVSKDVGRTVSPFWVAAAALGVALWAYQAPFAISETLSDSLLVPAKLVTGAIGVVAVSLFTSSFVLWLRDLEEARRARHLR